MIGLKGGYAFDYIALMCCYLFKTKGDFTQPLCGSAVLVATTVQLH